MNKIQSIIAFFLLSVIFTSCRKSYICQCTSKYKKDKGAMYTQVKYELSEYDRKTASASCKTRQTKYQYINGSILTTTCVLN